MAQVVELPSVSEAMIQDISRNIVKRFAPQKIILFGSHAYGAPRPESDVDLLVIMEAQGHHIESAAAILDTCRPRFVGMDVLVRTQREVDDRIRLGDAFFREIISRGRLLYERPE